VLKLEMEHAIVGVLVTTLNNKRSENEGFVPPIINHAIEERKECDVER